MSKRSAVVIAAVGVLAVGLVIFEPWAFFTNSTVNEAAPTAPTSDAAEPDASLPNPAGPTELASGTFVSQEHETSGTAKIFELPDGSRTLRLEDFSTTNGPDLHVWMSEKKAGGNWFKYGGGRKAQLGELKANQGSHNYAIPADVELDGLNSVVIWCKRFHVAFGSAPLT
ncbi:MAG: DM13 domain-containing protein [Aeromicrobium sp.]